MKRRTFLGAATGSAGLTALSGPQAIGDDASAQRSQTFSMDGHQVRIYSTAITQPVRLMVVADTHLFTDDDRGAPYHQYSARMAAAYHETKHFLSGESTSPSASFTDVLQLANREDFNFVALVGDIVSFPSEAAIDWVRDQLAALQRPYLYVAGNHDWHYEGMPGTLEELRATWIEKRLQPLYQEQQPLMARYEVGDVAVLAIDNSHYQILPEQLAFLRREIASAGPFVLTCHIPLYAPGRSVGFGCGHPGWGADSDRNHQLERRPRWPERHTQVTMDFHREVFAAPNLLGVFAGHIHRRSVDVINGIPQFVTDDNASGAYLDVRLMPLEHA